jgi:hypothetical protein
LDIRFLGSWVRAQENQLVILMGMIQAKLRPDYSTQVGEAQAGFGGNSNSQYGKFFTTFFHLNSKNSSNFALFSHMKPYLRLFSNSDTYVIFILRIAVAKRHAFHHVRVWVLAVS